MTARAEQETTVTFMRDDAVVRVYTSNVTHLRRLRKLVKSADYVTERAGGEDWGEFDVKSEYFHLFSAIRAKRAVSEAERAARAKRLVTARSLRRPASVDEHLREREV